MSRRRASGLSPVWQLVGTLLLVGFVLTYWWLVALVVVAVLAVKFGPGVWRRWQAQQAARRAALEQLIARADQQHQWVLQADERGIYGQYPAAPM